ncbi:hypothetical protein N825_11400 [Skermanella stibiiresistens SB22]|uniref:SrpA-related protein n=1 Tax=Skermanella stibiiresistens SB22 TaxID=1385369 RepID=W9H230_9PROT|nr:putative metalloprotease CJM1_0395 family protein [Skermanella stibiiresistens]EWY38767.1 hypothetical protein N825_11400 [Skermanella stibiiresistens SB22]
MNISAASGQQAPTSTVGPRFNRVKPCGCAEGQACNHVQTVEAAEASKSRAGVVDKVDVKDGAKVRDGVKVKDIVKGKDGSGDDGSGDGGAGPAEGSIGPDGTKTGEDGVKRDASGLTEAEREQVKELRKRDVEVRTHERAHQSAGGQFAGSPTYTYQSGPDGRRYAIGGEVSIDVSPEKDPAATVAKMERVKSAATAPAEPSPQDFKVAAAANQMLLDAQSELNKNAQENLKAGGARDDGAGHDHAGPEGGSHAADEDPTAGKPADPERTDRGDDARSAGSLITAAARAYREASGLGGLGVTGRASGALIGVTA